jgi:hypothetical protein
LGSSAVPVIASARSLHGAHVSFVVPDAHIERAVTGLHAVLGFGGR